MKISNKILSVLESHLILKKHLIKQNKKILMKVNYSNHLEIKFIQKCNSLKNL